jgi:hypothetical protein
MTQLFILLLRILINLTNDNAEGCSVILSTAIPLLHHDAKQTSQFDLLSFVVDVLAFETETMISELSLHEELCANTNSSTQKSQGNPFATRKKLKKSLQSSNETESRRKSNSINTASTYKFSEAKLDSSSTYQQSIYTESSNPQQITYNFDITIAALGILINVAESCETGRYTFKMFIC